MYVYDFICTYKLHEKGDQELMYRIQLLQAFGLEQWDDAIVESTINSLYDNIKENDVFKDIISEVRRCDSLKMMIALTGSDDLDVFKLLFKFELFDITHKCLCDYSRMKIITPDNRRLLSKCLCEQH